MLASNDPVHFRQNHPYTDGIISLTSARQLLQERGQGKQVLDPEIGAPGSQDQEGVRSLDVRPPGRQRAHAHVARHTKEHPLLAPAVGIAHELKRLVDQWVEGMDHTKTSRNGAIGCT